MARPFRFQPTKNTNKYNVLQEFLPLGTPSAISPTLEINIEF